jgi:uncharacterized damage-inducible protein DinB
MMNQPEPTFVELIRYHNWANSQIIAALQNLSPEQLAAKAPGVYGSLHRTLGHMLHSEADYIGRLTGKMPQPPFEWKAGPSVAEMAAFAPQLAAALLEAVQGIAPEHIVHEEEDGKYIDYTAQLLFMQAIIHGLEHRTNITTVLNGQLGLPEMELDGWGYLFSHARAFAMQEGTL